MKFLKTLLFNLAGQKNYLSIISSLFFLLYRSGLLRLFRKFDTHYVAPILVKRGFTVIDIGANLGYFSVIFASATGRKGKVLAVEPVEDFRRILARNIRKFPWVEIVPYALGASNGTIRMTIPGTDKTRHGLTRVAGENENRNSSYECSADMKKPSELFGDTGTVNYIKCDVEGYEAKLFPELMFLVESSRPIIQAEIAPENIEKIRNLIIPLGYRSFMAVKGMLMTLKENELPDGDIVFIPDEKIEDYLKLIIENKYCHP